MFISHSTRSTSSMFVILAAILAVMTINPGVRATSDNTRPLVTSTKVTPMKLTKNRINTISVTFGFEDIGENLRGGMLTLNLVSEKNRDRFWTFNLTDKVFDAATGLFTFQLAITPEEDDQFELSFWLRDSAGNNGGNESESVFLDVKSKTPKKKQGREKGTVPYSFTLLDQNGLPVSLSDYKGKVVLLDFCTMWCGPCKRQAAVMDLLYKKYEEQGLMILTVVSQNYNSQPPTAKECKAWAKTYGLSTPVLSDPLFGVYEGYTKERRIKRKTIPYNVIIDRKGVIRWNEFGFTPERYKQIEGMIKKLLEE